MTLRVGHVQPPCNLNVGEYASTRLLRVTHGECHHAVFNLADHYRSDIAHLAGKRERLTHGKFATSEERRGERGPVWSQDRPRSTGTKLCAVNSWWDNWRLILRNRGNWNGGGRYDRGESSGNDNTTIVPLFVVTLIFIFAATRWEGRIFCWFGGRIFRWLDALVRLFGVARRRRRAWVR